MTSTPVKLPNRINGFRSRVINGLIDYVAMLTPADSTSIRHEFRPDGVLAKVIQQRDLPTSEPYDWYWSAAKTINIVNPCIRVHYYKLADGLLSSRLLRATISEPDHTLVLPDAASAASAYVYIGITWDPITEVVTNLALASDGASFPDDTQTPTVPNLQYFYFPLYRFDTLGDGSTGANAIYACTKRYQRGMIHVWPHTQLWQYDVYNGIRPTI